jgi:6,7-dimethyl-8-ribityllumazine synthase
MASSQDSNSLLDTSVLQQLNNPRVAIVHTEWNEKIVMEQLLGCNRILAAHNSLLTGTYVVPGCFEIPYACHQIALQKSETIPEAIIAFGAVIRGGTPHFDYVCKAVTEGIAQLNITLSIPVIFGVLTLDNELQAWERLGGIHGHKGEEAAIAALKMIQFKRNLSL